MTVGEFRKVSRDWFRRALMREIHAIAGTDPAKTVWCGPYGYELLDARSKPSCQ